VNASIHKVNECVRVADIDALQRMYVSVLRRLLTDAPLGEHRQTSR
jgi:acetylornithine deacetylase/succinyl-diaminopimelate desuccinylase-like protein